MSLNLSDKRNKKVNTKSNNKKNSQAKDTFLSLFIIGLVCFIFGYKSWGKVLDKHVKY